MTSYCNNRTIRLQQVQGRASGNPKRGRKRQQTGFEAAQQPTLSIGVKNTRSHCSSQRMAHQEEVPSCNYLCGPLQFTIIYLPAKINERRRNIGGEDLIREICGAARSQSPSVPSGQRKIRGDDLHESNQGRRSDDYFLRSQRTLSEWSGGKKDQESPRSSKDNADSCSTPLADRNRCPPMAIRPTKCERGFQQRTDDDLTGHEVAN